MRDVIARREPLRIEWPTVALAAMVYLSFGVITWFYHSLPWWLLLPVGGYVIALHGSLMHEAVHGHPTNRPWINELLVSLSLWLWLPFRIYRKSHLTHHSNETLTDPLQDPESNYVSAEQWARFGLLRRSYWQLRGTVAGRMLLVPLSSMWEVYSDVVMRLRQGKTINPLAWGLHLLGLIPVATWAFWVCDIPVIAYIAFFAYPGLALTVLRSYLEHQASPIHGERTAIVEAGPVMSLLYLNNNLHVVHHARPDLPWYKLPQAYRKNRDAWLAQNGGYYIKGYGQIIKRFLFKAKEPIQHPLS